VYSHIASFNNIHETHLVASLRILHQTTIVALSKIYMKLNMSSSLIIQAKVMKLKIMERQAIVKIFRTRYKYASKYEKSIIIKEFIEITGFNRNYASQILRGHHEYSSKKKRKSKRKPYYDELVLKTLIRIWEILDYICGKRLVRIIPEIIKKMEQFDEIYISKDTKEKLCKISASSIDRLLKPAKKRLGRKGTSTTKQPRYLIDKIKIKTFTEWKNSPPGFTQLDLVAHNGGNVFGGFVYTLNTVDICIGWTICNIVKNKTKLQMLKGLVSMRKEFPYKVMGIHSDNGAEFINETVLAFTNKYNIEFTRGRPYKKNDNPHVEQKNYSIVRRNTGYLRYDKPEHTKIIKKLYKYLNLYTNYFQPIMMLLEKHRQGSKAIRKYDVPKTPYQRLLEHPDISTVIKKKAMSIYKELNPVELKQKINECQANLIHSATPIRKPVKAKKKRRKKEMKHTIPVGRRESNPKNPNPFLEKQKLEEMRRAAQLVWNQRKKTSKT